MCGFRRMLKKRAALYKKAVGEEVDKEKLKEIIWSVMDADSKILATRMELAKGGFDKTAGHIDQRYQITYGHVEQGPKDDPMGIFALIEQERPEPAAANAKNTSQEQQPDYIDQHLDAFGKGKGKGFTSNGGRCNVCNGEGRIARDCPSSPGQDGKATGDTCFGCNGKGHRKRLGRQPILISKAVEKAKEGGSKMAEKAKEEVMDKSEVGSRKAEKAKEAEQMQRMGQRKRRRSLRTGSLGRK